MSRKYFIICLVCALWTVIQTSFHLVFVIYSYYLSICETSPTDVNSIFYYLTYLYNSNCNPPKLVLNDNHSSTPEAYLWQLVHSLSNKNISENNTLTLEEVVISLLHKLDYFPNNAASSSRSSVFLLCFIILDGTWIVSAVSLLMGTCFGIKESLSLVFYGPWLVVTICVSLFDAVASIFFGFDITSTGTFSDWLSFVGITETSTFPDYDSRGIPISLTTSPSLALCAVSSRFIIIWIANWIGFIFVIKATISVYKESYKNETNRPGTFIDSPSERYRTDTDTTAARIRNWQIFYGAVDATSTHSSKSVESDKDLNSNNHKESKTELSEIHGETSNVSNYYYAYPDVAESIFMGDVDGCLEELRGQLPWSYTEPLNGKDLLEEKIEMERIAKNIRTNSDSSSSGR